MKHVCDRYNQVIEEILQKVGAIKKISLLSKDVLFEDKVIFNKERI